MGSPRVRSPPGRKSRLARRREYHGLLLGNLTEPREGPECRVHHSSWNNALATQSRSPVGRSMSSAADRAQAAAGVVQPSAADRAGAADHVLRKKSFAANHERIAVGGGGPCGADRGTGFDG